ncbi:hypothetical protein Sru01_30520 [Sphaerisporangium rufum]|uniref:Uncharacterized protein n=1 Tax=Sphaerisporangium rufum TaxID=1381558 RepID=A0A919R4A1_9ACTN|nr:hypothetical protein [Sphaerisporangium rufum]GII78070.1 hypothetical protein Sru01_30520 [Sphaerisporangium rufum]
MSEGPLGTAKQTRMSAVQAAITNTKMAGAKLWNAWPQLIETGVKQAERSAPAGGGNVPEIIPDGRSFDQIKKVHLRTLGDAAGLGGPVTAGNLAEARRRLRDQYVAAGRANYKGLLGGNCTLFACCVIGMLADQPDLLGKGVKVEVLNLLDTTGGSGHAYVVVGRADGDVKDIKTYGPDCFFVDQWYARHRGTEPGVLAVKDATPGEKGNRFWDFDFYAFIDDATIPALRLAFTSDELPGLGV